MQVFHPAFGHVINVQAFEVSDEPDTQVHQVVDMMRGYSRHDGDTPELAEDAAATNWTGDPLADTFRAIGGRLRFVQDAETAAPFTGWLRSGDVVETLVRPLDMRRMRYPAGDCDDFAMSTAALLRAKGVPSSFVTVAVDPLEPGRYSHVYVAANCDGGVCGPGYSGRVPLDTSHGAYVGWECPNPFGKRKDWPLDGDDYQWMLAAAGVAIAVAAVAWWVRKSRAR